MKRLLILCNALDDAMRAERGIATDSPAGSRKIFMAARALAGAGVAATVISLGRGRYTGSTRYFGVVARRSWRVPICYLPFVDRPVVSQLLTLGAAALVVARRSRRPGRTCLLIYNRSIAYVPAVAVARLCGMRVVLDLEDGYTGTGTTLRERLVRLGCRLFDTLCGSRALLACTALAAATRLRPTMVYYGIADEATPVVRAPRDDIVALLSGTIAPETGGELVADAVVALRRDAPPWVRYLTIEVTGNGPSLARLTVLAADSASPRVRVWGRITDAEYAAIRARVDVGLALKLNHGPLAQTTFPSKVIEMAAAGQLVVTTDISDVRLVFGDDGALFVTRDAADAVIEQLRWIVEHREAAAARAVQGSAAVARICAPAAAGERLAAFLFGDAA